MVDDYRLTREAQLQAAEGVFRQDEDYRATTFKQWLQAFEWESAYARDEQDVAEQDAAEYPAAEPDAEDRCSGDADPWAVAIPVQRAAEHDRLAVASAAEDLVAEAAEVARAGRLARWHTDDHSDHADVAERGSADLAELYGRSA